MALALKFSLKKLLFDFPHGLFSFFVVLEFITIFSMVQTSFVQFFLFITLIFNLTCYATAQIFIFWGLRNEFFMKSD